jgi:hypothetical protein
VTKRVSGHVQFESLQSPEHSDVCSFGRLLYELCTGEECTLTHTSNYPASIPMALQQILTKIFAPAEDYPTIGELLAEP